MKVALTHDYLISMNGPERILTNFLEIYNNAPIYTSVCDKDNLDGILKDANIVTSYLQNSLKSKSYMELLRFMPSAFESFHLKEYDVVLSSSSFGAKGVITSPDTMHICYYHSPIIYNEYNEYNVEDIKEFYEGTNINFMTAIRMWDFLATNRVDYFIVNSENTARKVWKYYRRESMIIHPPVRYNFFNISDVDEEYFLIVSRLLKGKRIEIAIDAFNELNLPLIIIGDGPMRKGLEEKAKSNIKFLGRQGDEVVKEYYAKCRALIFPGEDDFGIVPLEAQASGRPIIAYGKGGALETVISGETGVFFKEQNTEGLINAVRRFELINFDKEKIREHAAMFNEERFKLKLENFIENKYTEWNLKKHWYKL